MRLHLNDDDGGERFQHFDVTTQSKHWDDVTAAVVLSRLGRPPDIRFFTPKEEATARALFDQLLDQMEEPRVPIVNMVDARLAEDQTDGWHYEGMPPDGEAWRDSLARLDTDSLTQFECDFASATWSQQMIVLQKINDLGEKEWHGVPAKRVWSLWTRYACSAFYSHPWAWNEIGFPGPAYPRGYKNLGVNRLESYEVPDNRDIEAAKQWPKRNRL